MRHATLAKRKQRYQDREDDSYLDKRNHVLSSSAYRHAKQHSFLSGGDVLKSLQAEIEIDEGTTPAVLRIMGA